MLTATTTIDLVVLVLVALAAVGGWRRGGAALATHLVGLVVGLVVGLRVAGLLSGSLSPAAHVLLGLLCALGGLVIGGALGRRIGRRVSVGVQRAHLGLLDKILGAGARALGAAVAVWFVLALIVAVGPSDWATDIRRARLADAGRVPVVGPVVTGVGRAVTSAAPSDVAALVPDIDPDTTSTRQVRRVAARVEGSVFEIGATGCRGSVVGTAFAAAAADGGDLVVTNAHVVRAATMITLYVPGEPGGGLSAVPLLVDHRADLAVLRVDGLDAAPLSLAARDAANGTRAVVVGYPHGGPRRAVPAVVEQRLPVPDPGFSDGLALHVSYRLAADIEPGNSGSPLLDTHGRVLGVVNATAGSGTGQGYAITHDELRADLRTASGVATTASTGSC